MRTSTPSASSSAAAANNEIRCYPHGAHPHPLVKTRTSEVQPTSRQCSLCRAQLHIDKGEYFCCVSVFSNGPRCNFAICQKCASVFERPFPTSRLFLRGCFVKDAPLRTRPKSDAHVLQTQLEPLMLYEAMCEGAYPPPQSVSDTGVATGNPFPPGTPLPFLRLNYGGWIQSDTVVPIDALASSCPGACQGAGKMLAQLALYHQRRTKNEHTPPPHASVVEEAARIATELMDWPTLSSRSEKSLLMVGSSSPSSSSFSSSMMFSSSSSPLPSSAHMSHPNSSNSTAKPRYVSPCGAALQPGRAPDYASIQRMWLGAVLAAYICHPGAALLGLQRIHAAGGGGGGLGGNSNDGNSQQTSAASRQQQHHHLLDSETYAETIGRCVQKLCCWSATMCSLGLGPAPQRPAILMETSFGMLASSSLSFVAVWCGQCLSMRDLSRKNALLLKSSNVDDETCFTALSSSQAPTPQQVQQEQEQEHHSSKTPLSVEENNNTTTIVDNAQALRALHCARTVLALCKEVLSELFPLQQVVDEIGPAIKSSRTLLELSVVYPPPHLHVDPNRKTVLHAVLRTLDWSLNVMGAAAAVKAPAAEDEAMSRLFFPRPTAAKARGSSSATATAVAVEARTTTREQDEPSADGPSLMLQPGGVSGADGAVGGATSASSCALSDSELLMLSHIRPLERVFCLRDLAPAVALVEYLPPDAYPPLPGDVCRSANKMFEAVVEDFREEQQQQQQQQRRKLEEATRNSRGNNSTTLIIVGDDDDGDDANDENHLPFISSTPPDEERLLIAEPSSSRSASHHHHHRRDERRTHATATNNSLLPTAAAETVVFDAQMALSDIDLVEVVVRTLHTRDITDKFGSCAMAAKAFGNLVRGNDFLSESYFEPVVPKLFFALDRTSNVETAISLLQTLCDCGRVVAARAATAAMMSPSIECRIRQRPTLELEMENSRFHGGRPLFHQQQQQQQQRHADISNNNNSTTPSSKAAGGGVGPATPKNDDFYHNNNNNNNRDGGSQQQQQQQSSWLLRTPASSSTFPVIVRRIASTVLVGRQHQHQHGSTNASSASANDEDVGAVVLCPDCASSVITLSEMSITGSPSTLWTSSSSSSSLGSAGDEDFATAVRCPLCTRWRAESTSKFPGQDAAACASPPPPFQQQNQNRSNADASDNSKAIHFTNNSRQQQQQQQPSSSPISSVGGISTGGGGGGGGCSDAAHQPWWLIPRIDAEKIVERCLKRFGSHAVGNLCWSLALLLGESHSNGGSSSSSSSSKPVLDVNQQHNANFAFYRRLAELTVLATPGGTPASASSSPMSSQQQSQQQSMQPSGNSATASSRPASQQQQQQQHQYLSLSSSSSSACGFPTSSDWASSEMRPTVIAAAHLILADRSWASRAFGLVAVVSATAVSSNSSSSSQQQQQHSSSSTSSSSVLPRNHPHLAEILAQVLKLGEAVDRVAQQRQLQQQYHHHIGPHQSSSSNNSIHHSSNSIPMGSQQQQQQQQQQQHQHLFGVGVVDANNTTSQHKNTKLSFSPDSSMASSSQPPFASVDVYETGSTPNSSVQNVSANAINMSVGSSNRDPSPALSFSAMSMGSFQASLTPGSDFRLPPVTCSSSSSSQQQSLVPSQRQQQHSQLMSSSSSSSSSCSQRQQHVASASSSQLATVDGEDGMSTNNVRRQLYGS